VSMWSRSAQELVALNKVWMERDVPVRGFLKRGREGSERIPFKHSERPSAATLLWMAFAFSVADFRTQLQLKKNGTTCRCSGQETAMEAQPLYSSASHAHP